MKTLEIGDRIYSIHYGKIGSAYTIDRVTKTQAISSSSKFKREYKDDGWGIKKIGESGWNSINYQVETPELKEKYIEQNLRYQLDKIDMRNLPIDKVRAILEIIN